MEYSSVFGQALKSTKCFYTDAYMCNIATTLVMIAKELMKL